MTKLKDLQLGDVVQLYTDISFSTSVVIQIKDGRIKFFRPYAVTSDISYTCGVIPYIGIEQHELELEYKGEMEVKLLERKHIK